MIKVVGKGQETYISRNWDDIVRQMKLDSYTVLKTINGYMKKVTKRQEIFNGQKIEYTDSKSFLYELMRTGEIISIEEQENLQTK